MRWYVVTGASSGIGRATARALASRGCQVIAVARNQGRLQSLRERYGEKIRIVPADISTKRGIDALLEATGATLRIDGIVHAAGSSLPLMAYQNMSLTEKVLEPHFSVHVSAPIEINNSLSSKLPGSRILFLDSYSADTPRVGWAGYSIVKAAAQMAARCAAAELEQSTVIRLYPGGVRTPLVESVLASTEQSDVVKVFKKLDQDGELSDADAVGTYVANLLIDASDCQLASREYWDFTQADDRIFSA